MAPGNQWTWDEEKTDAILMELKNYIRQKLGEGFEWDSDKVAMLESVRKKRHLRMSVYERLSQASG